MSHFCHAIDREEYEHVKIRILTSQHSLTFLLHPRECPKNFISIGIHLVAKIWYWIKFIKPQIFCSFFFQNMQIWVYWIFWDHKTACIFYLFSCFRSVVLGGSSVKNSCQSERYFQRYSNFSGAMLLKKRLFRCVTLMSRYVCLFITNKILEIDSKFLRSVIGD